VTAAILVVAGAALSFGTWSHGDHGVAVAPGAFYAVAATVG